METSHQPFRRVMEFIAAVNVLVAGGMSRAAAIATQDTYRSRGKGLGKHSGKSVGRNFPTSFKCNASGSDLDHNGARECARRVRQMENGQLHFATFNHKPAIQDMMKNQGSSAKEPEDRFTVSPATAEDYLNERKAA